MEKKEMLINEFEKLYGHRNCRVFFAPGRVNLIGEHTDYNGGYVFPCALSFGTYLAVATREDKVCNFASLNMDLKKQVDISKPIEKVEGEWINYPIGVMKEFFKKDIELPGMDMLFLGEIPTASGLSSSASIEVLSAYAFSTLTNSNIDRVELSLMSQRAEREYIGVMCGIMDQFIIANGVKDNALALDCNTLKFETVPCEIGDYKIVVMNTKKPRGLVDSKYNERCEECAEAVTELSKEDKIETLCQLNNEQFEAKKELISSEVVRRRAKHAISENQRVFEAVDALKSADLVNFGKMMNASHDSLREDYEVTGFELDTLVDEARKVEGVLGARMTGAGFGGCAVSLVHKNSVDTFIETVGKEYEAKTKLTPEFYVAEVGDGVMEVN